MQTAELRYLPGMEPKYIEYPLRVTPEMQDRAAAMASAARQSLDVWIREAIREKLERDEAHD